LSLPNRGRGVRCARIERTVAEVMECELLPSLEDPDLADLHVVGVEVTNNLACVRVSVCPGSTGGPRDAAAIATALRRAENRLRMELAEAVRMKRVPVLRLTFIPLAIWSQGGGDV